MTPTSLAAMIVCPLLGHRKINNVRAYYNIPTDQSKGNLQYLSKEYLMKFCKMCCTVLLITVPGKLSPKRTHEIRVLPKRILTQSCQNVFYKRYPKWALRDSAKVNVKKLDSDSLQFHYWIKGPRIHKTTAVQPQTTACRGTVLQQTLQMETVQTNCSRGNQAGDGR